MDKADDLTAQMQEDMTSDEAWMALQRGFIVARKSWCKIKYVLIPSKAIRAEKLGDGAIKNWIESMGGVVHSWRVIVELNEEGPSVCVRDSLPKPLEGEPEYNDWYTLTTINY